MNYLEHLITQQVTATLTATLSRTAEKVAEKMADELLKDPDFRADMLMLVRRAFTHALEVLDTSVGGNGEFP